MAGKTDWKKGDVFIATAFVGDDCISFAGAMNEIVGSRLTVADVSLRGNGKKYLFDGRWLWLAELQTYIDPDTGRAEAVVAEETKAVGDTRFKDVAVVRSGDKITLPEGMSYEEAVKWLRTREKEDDNKIAIMESIECYPFDGAYALTKALAEIYGWVGLVPTPGWFGSQNPPVIISIEVDVDKKVQIPWGRLAIPALQGGFIETAIGKKDGRFIFQINGEIKQKFKTEVRRIADLTREIVRRESIYRGKAFHINLEDETRFNPDNCPRFIDTTKIVEDDLILTDEVRRQVQNSLFTPLEKTELCRSHKIPLKRGILFEGPYGTGKTLTAYVASKKAVQNGWTFIYLAQVSQLASAIQMAAQYAPAVIFGEDIDRAMAGERSVEIDAVLNTIDGIDTKGKEVIVCLTTNHVENINPAMLRPGRLDAVISVKPPDAKAAEQLVRTYARGLIDSSIDIREIGKKLDGHIPAVIREMVERAKLAAITRLRAGDELVLTVEDLDAATESMLNHLKLMEKKEPDTIQPAVNRIAKAMADEMAHGLFANGNTNSIRQHLKEVLDEYVSQGKDG